MIRLNQQFDFKSQTHHETYFIFDFKLQIFYHTQFIISVELMRFSNLYYHFKFLGQKVYLEKKFFNLKKFILAFFKLEKHLFDLYNFFLIKQSLFESENFFNLKHVRF